MRFRSLSLICLNFKGRVSTKASNFFRSLRHSSTTTEIERKFIINQAIIDYCKQNAESPLEKSMCDVYFDNNNLDLTTRDMWLRQRNDELELKWPMLLEITKNKSPHTSPIALSGLDFYNESTDLAKISSVIHETAGVAVEFGSQTEKSNDMKEKIRSLHNAGIQPFGTIITNRTRYNLNMKLPAKFRTSASSSHQGGGSQDIVKLFVDIDLVQYVLPKLRSGEDDSSRVPSIYVIGEIEFNFDDDSPTFTARISQEDRTTTSTSADRDKDKVRDTDRHAAIMQHVFHEMGIQPAPVRGKVLEYLARYRPDHYEALRRSGQLATKGL